MSAKSESVAGDLVRSYNYVRRFVGPRFVDQDGTWILSRPSFDETELENLAALLLQAEPDRREIARAIGAREVLEVSPGKLGKGAYHLGRLSDRALLRRLISEGVRPLRSFRGRDLDGLLDECAAALEQATNGGPPTRGLAGVVESLFGEVVGRRLVEGFEAAQSRELSVGEQRASKTAEFVSTAEHLDAGLGPPEQHLSALWTVLAKLPERPEPRARALVGAFREFVAGRAVHELGRRRTLEAAVRGRALVDAARTLAELTTPEPEQPEVWSAEDRANLLELALRLRDVPVELPAKRGRWLQTLTALSREVDTTRLRALWPHLLPLNQQQLDTARWPIIRSTLDGQLLAAGLELGVLGRLDDFDGETGVRAYLDAVRRLRERPIPNIEPDAEWFVEPFRSGQAWQASFVLGLLAAHHDAPETLITTLAASRATGFADLGFTDDFATWDAPRVVHRPSEAERLQQMLDLPEEAIARYLHWRRIAGYGETFSEALLKPLGLREAEQAELDHLRGLPLTPALEQRVAKLADPSLHALRLEAACRRARRAFDRALEVLRQESLAATVEATAQRAFERLLGRPVDGPLPARIRAVMLLVGAQHIDLQALRSFLEDVVRGGELSEREANRRWLATMSARGIDTERWLGGVDLTLSANGEALRFQTETDPLHVLEMGSYFDTCLSLEHGFNAASTLTNALDVNKQVLYGRRTDGTVVARKLIAATDDGTMVGYRTYAFEPDARINAALDEGLAAFADACGLALADQGAPAPLHGTFWYDDGVESWSARRQQVPDDVPGDEQGVWEWAYVRGFTDPEAWRWVAAAGGWQWSSAAAARLRMAGGAPAGVDRDAWRAMAARGFVGWLGEPDAHPWEQLEAANPSLPTDEGVIRDFVARVHALKAPTAEWMHDHMVCPPRPLALLQLHEIVGHVLDHMRIGRAARLECFVEQHDDCIEMLIGDTADILQASWQRHGGGGGLERLLEHRDFVARRIGVELAARIADPSLARRLRQLLKEYGPDGKLEWAVARQSDKASLWALRNLLEVTPDALDVAAALVAFGTDDDAAFARDTVVLPATFSCSPGVIRALAPLKLPRQWFDGPDELEQRQLVIGRLAATGHPEADPARFGTDGEAFRRAFAFAVALREAKADDVPKLWSDHIAGSAGAAFAPSVPEGFALSRALLRPRPDLDAVRFHLRDPRHVRRVGMVAFTATPEAMREVCSALGEVTLPSWQTSNTRYLFAALPEGFSRAQHFGVTDADESWLLLGPDPEAWRRHLDEVAANGTVSLAVELAKNLANQVDPQTYASLVLELLDRHGALFLTDSAAVVSQMVATDRWDHASYRLAELYVSWAGPRVSEEVRRSWVGAVEGRPWEGWLRERIGN